MADTPPVIREIKFEPLTSSEKEITINVIKSAKNKEHVYKITVPLMMLTYCDNWAKIFSNIDKNDLITIYNGVHDKYDNLINDLYYIYGCYRVGMGVNDDVEQEYSVKLDICYDEK